MTWMIWGPHFRKAPDESDEIRCALGLPSFFPTTRAGSTSACGTRHTSLPAVIGLHGDGVVHSCRAGIIIISNPFYSQGKDTSGNPLDLGHF